MPVQHLADCLGGDAVHALFERSFESSLERSFEATAGGRPTAGCEDPNCSARFAALRFPFADCLA
jgi:hypothetical protein